MPSDAETSKRRRPKKRALDTSALDVPQHPCAASRCPGLTYGLYCTRHTALEAAARAEGRNLSGHERDDLADLLLTFAEEAESEEQFFRRHPLFARYASYSRGIRRLATQALDALERNNLVDVAVFSMQMNLYRGLLQGKELHKQEKRSRAAAIAGKLRRISDSIVPPETIRRRFSQELSNGSSKRQAALALESELGVSYKTILRRVAEMDKTNALSPEAS